MGRFVTRGLTSYNKKVRLPTYVATYEVSIVSRAALPRHKSGSG